MYVSECALCEVISRYYIKLFTVNGECSIRICDLIIFPLEVRSRKCEKSYQRDCNQSIHIFSTDTSYMSEVSRSHTVRCVRAAFDVQYAIGFHKHIAYTSKMNFVFLK